ncbi:hypothetical protein Emed_005698 [Eimeria media]
MADRGSSNGSRGRSNSPGARSNTSSQPMYQTDYQEEERTPAPSPPPISPRGDEARKVSAVAAAAADAAADAAAAAADAAAAEKPSSSKISSAFSPSLQKAPTTKSQVSFSESVGGLSKRTSMTSGQFMSFRQRSSMGYLLPSNFFQSQADIRTWGVEDLTDPSVQPYDKDAQGLPRPFHTSLPGYTPRLFKYVLVGGKKEERERFLGPEISVFPPTWCPQFSPNPNFKAQRYGYNWEDSEAFKMNRLPYVNAEFDPVSAEASSMYNQCYPYTAYPYGVPRVA